jgi:hypothetical protein
VVFLDRPYSEARNLVNKKLTGQYKILWIFSDFLDKSMDSPAVLACRFFQFFSRVDDLRMPDAGQHRQIHMMIGVGMGGGEIQPVTSGQISDPFRLFGADADSALRPPRATAKGIGFQPCADKKIRSQLSLHRCQDMMGRGGNNDDGLPGSPVRRHDLQGLGYKGAADLFLEEAFSLFHEIDVFAPPVCA